jgi:hypothetical protein
VSKARTRTNREWRKTLRKLPSTPQFISHKDKALDRLLGVVRRAVDGSKPLQPRSYS